MFSGSKERKRTSFLSWAEVEDVDVRYLNLMTYLQVNDNSVEDPENELVMNSYAFPEH